MRGFEKMGWAALVVGGLTACGGGGGGGDDAGTPDDGIDRRTCESGLTEVTQFPNAVDAELLTASAATYYLGVESTTVGEDGPTVWEARLAELDPATGEEASRVAIPLAGDTWDAELIERADGTLLLAAVGNQHFEVLALDADGTVLATVNPVESPTDFYANVEVVSDGADGVLVAILRAPAILDPEATLEVHHLVGSGDALAPAGEPTLLASLDGGDSVDMLSPLHLVPSDDGFHVLFGRRDFAVEGTGSEPQIEPDYVLRAVEMDAAGAAVDVELAPLGTARISSYTVLTTENRLRMLYVTGYLPNTTALFYHELGLDLAPVLDEAVSLVHPDGRTPGSQQHFGGPLHLVEDGNGLLASYLGGKEDNYVFHVLPFVPGDAQPVQEAGVIAFSGAALASALTLPLEGGDYLYLFGRTTAADDGALHLLRGSCTLTYPAPEIE